MLILRKPTTSEMRVSSSARRLGLFLSCFVSRTLASAVPRTTHHMVTKNPMMASAAISIDLNLSQSQSLFLIDFGAVFLQRKGDAKARRLLRDESVDIDDYLRVYPHPKRFNVDGIDWGLRVIHQTSDYIIINKPAMVPSNPTTDNAYENVVECFKRHMNLPVLYLPHRLDLETSGLMVLGKTKDFTAHVSLQFKARKVDKRYRALIATSHENALPYRPNQMLVHFMEPSTTSPRVFMNEPPGIECRSTIVSASRVVSKSASAWADWSSSALHVSEEHRRLRHAMKRWLTEIQPETRVAFCSIELCLLSGRTHQCRGQLSSGDWHIAGDNMYPGCTSCSLEDATRVSEHLALQSSHLSFYESGSKATFELNEFWWEPIFTSK